MGPLASVRDRYDALCAQIGELEDQLDALRPQLMTQVFSEQLNIYPSWFAGVSDFSAYWDFEASSDMYDGASREGEVTVEYKFTQPDGHVISVQHVMTYTYHCTHSNREEPDEAETFQLVVDGTREYEYDNDGQPIGVFQPPECDSDSEGDTEENNWASLMNAILSRLSAEHSGVNGWHQLMRIELD